MQSMYSIAGILLIVDAVSELQDSEAFSLYRITENRAEAVHKQNEGDIDRNQVQNKSDIDRIRRQNDLYKICMIPEADDQLPTFTGKIVFEDETNQVLLSEGEYIHLFRIPFSSGFSAWNKITDEKTVEIHYRQSAEKYFMNAVGCFNAASFERILYAYRKYLFHCSYVDAGGEAILFSAPSGGGKTTQGKLWEQFGHAEMINGDRAVLEKGENEYLVHGLPIAGSSGVFTNRTTTLKAIFVVRKAVENRAVRLSHQEAFQAVFSEVTINTWNDGFVLDTVDFVLELVQKVPVYRLDCTISEEAVRTVQNILQYHKTEEIHAERK